MLGCGRECSRRLIASNLQSTIRDLQRRKARGRRGLALIEGVRLVEEALAAGVAFTGALVAPDLARTARGTALVAELEGHAVAVEEVGARVLAQLADSETPQGIIAVIEPRRWTARDFVPAPGAVALVIDGVQDPGNVGTLIRTAHALGAAGTVVLRGTADPTSPKALRAAMGATFRHPVVSLDDAGFIAWARKHGVTLWASAVDGVPLQRALDRGQGKGGAGRVDGPIAVIVGNEGAGIRPQLNAVAAQRVAIPLAGGAESLNVAVAAGILLYEVLRGRWCGDHRGRGGVGALLRELPQRVHPPAPARPVAAQASLPLPALQTADRVARQHPRVLVVAAARQVPLVPQAHLRPVSGHRGARGRTVGSRRPGLRPLLPRDQRRGLRHRAARDRHHRRPALPDSR